MGGRNRRLKKEENRQTRKLARATLPLGVVLVLLFSSMGAWGTARAGPLTCQTYVVVSASTTPTSTNVTITWSISLQSSVTLTWGNTSNYPFTQINGTVFAAGQHTTFINFLEPSNSTYTSKYYFHILAIKSPPSPFVCPGTYSGTFNTLTETLSSSSQIYLNGVFLNQTGSPGAAGQLVFAHCSDWIGSWQDAIWGSAAPYYWMMYTHTTATGSFSLPIGALSYGNYVNVCDQAGVPTVVSILTYGPTICDYDNQCAYGSYWGGIGAWNETLELWDRPYINSEVTTDFVTKPIVQMADFSNANASYGFPASALSYTAGSTYTTSSSHCWTALFLFSGCSEASNQVGTSPTYYADGHNLVVTQQLWESGTLLFDGLSRQCILMSENYYRGYSPPVNEPASWPIQDKMVPGNSSLYPLYYWGGEYNQGIKVYSTAPVGDALTVTSTSTSYQVQGFTIDVAYEIYGVSIGTTIVSDQWSQTSSSTTSNTLGWTVYGNSQTVPICYVVYGVGGATSASQTTADAVGIWAYAPRYSGGAYSCPMPT